MIITSNRAPSDGYPRFPNPVVAESLLDRLINAGHQVIMNGPSYRPNKRPRSPTAKPSTDENRLGIGLRDDPLETQGSGDHTAGVLDAS